MKGVLAPLIGIAVVAIVAGAMFVAPRQRADRFEAAVQADAHLQRARRLLLEYDPQLNFEAELREVLGVEDFELADEPNVERQYAQRLNSNGRLLQAALGEVNQALGVSVRDVSMRQDGSSNRLHGIILYEQGLALAQRLSILRSEMADVRSSMQRRVLVLEAVEPEVNIVRASGIDDRIADSVAQLEALEAELATQRQLTGTLAQRVERLADELESAREESDMAREDMESLEDVGVDLTDPNGLVRFKQRYGEASSRYRFLVLQAQALEFGSLDNAAADDPAIGTYEPIIAGQGIGYRRGLVHYRQDLEIAQTTLGNLEAAVAMAQQNVAELEGLKQAYSDRAARAEAVIAAELDAITAAGAEPPPVEDTEGTAEEDQDAAAQDDAYMGELEILLAIDEEVGPLEDEAIEKFEDAARAFQVAVNGVGTEMREAGAAAPSDPTRAEYHYSHLAKDQRQLQGHIRAQQAEAKLRQALVLVGRSQDAMANARVLESLQDLVPAEDIVATWQDLQIETSEVAEALINEAIDDLDKAKSEIGDGNWIIAAEIGSAHFMLSSLGVDLAEQKALMWYELALENRESEPFASEHVRMRDFIRRSAGGG